MKHQVYYNVYLIKLKFKYKKSNFGKREKTFSKITLYFGQCCSKRLPKTKSNIFQTTTANFKQNRIQFKQNQENSNNLVLNYIKNLINLKLMLLETFHNEYQNLKLFIQEYFYIILLKSFYIPSKFSNNFVTNLLKCNFKH